MDRRKFLSLSATGVISLSFADQLARLSAMTKKSVDNYNIVIIGDTHYDTEPSSIYHSKYYDPNEKSDKLHREEWVRNGKMWKDLCPRLLDRASKLVDNDTKMLFQMGDLIQGDCGDPEIHKKMLADGFKVIKDGLKSNLPLITVVGNHDIRGLNAKEAYDEFMPKVISKELNQEVTCNNYSFNIGEDAFIAIDFNHPNVELMKQLLEETKGARHTFVLCHGPIFPNDGTYPTWFLFGARKSKPNTSATKYFHNEFAKRNAIVLCGHTHLTELFDYYNEYGRITQMTMNSVWKREDLGTYKELVDNPKLYGARNISKDPELKALFEQYIPNLKRYSVATTAGSYKLSVSADKIIVDMYAGDSKNISKKFILR